MSVDEIRSRGLQVVRRRQERMEWQRATTGTRVHGLNAKAVVRKAQQLVAGANSQELTELEAEFPDIYHDLRERTRENAQAIYQSTWGMLGYEFDLRGKIDWHKDPRTEFRWKRVFYADIPLSKLPHGTDFKYVWELGRHQFVVELARAWSLMGEERFSHRARELILDWIAENPLYEGIHWTSGLEVAMRAISWIWTLASLAEWNSWRDDELNRIVQSLAEHAIYLEGHLEFYSSPYNHLIGEATGLFLLGMILEEHPNARHWQRVGHNVLQEHGPKQFYEDGFCVEQATGYHFYTLGFLTMAIVAARANQESMGDLERIAHRAYRAGAAFRLPDGRWPSIGDVDCARAFPVHHRDFWRFDSLSALGAVVFGDATLNAPGNTNFDELYWVMGCGGLRTSETLTIRQSQTRRVILPDSGYVIAANSDDWLLFEAGPIAAGVFSDATPSAAHGHADTLQVLYSMQGQVLLRDSGMAFYNGDPAWVRYFRSPEAHNTIEVEGVEVAKFAGGLSWTHVAATPELHADLSESAWMACGKAEWAPGVTIERHLLCLPQKGLWIADWIQTDRTRQVRWNWQLGNGLSLFSSARHNGNSAAYRHMHVHSWSTTPDLRAELQTARPGSPIGYDALGYGEWIEGRRLVESATVTDPLLVVHYFGPLTESVSVQIRGKRLYCTFHSDDVRRNGTHNIDEDNLGDRAVWRLNVDGVHTTFFGSEGTQASQ